MCNDLGYTIEKLEIIESEIGKCANEERKKNLEVIKENILKFMRADFKIINSRDVYSIGYDAEKKICVIHYNHFHSGQTLYYYNISHEQFDELLATDSIVLNVDRIFKTIKYDKAN